MGHFERQADQHAEEMGRLEDLEQRADRQWDRLRDELAERLANGDTLKAGGRPILGFDELTDRLWGQYDDQGQRALQLCAISPSLGGRHVRKLLVEIAQELVDRFADAFKQDIFEGEK